MNTAAASTKPWIAIEGPAGAGKTTLCGLLAKKLKIQAYFTPPSPLREAREDLERIASPRASLLFNLLGVKICSDLHRVSGQGGVVDRYYFSTFIYTAETVDAVVAGELLRAFDIMTPTATVVIAVDEEERLRRVSLRDGRTQTPFRHRVNALSTEEYLRRYRLLFNREPLIIDSTRLSPDELVTAICTLIGHA